MRRAPLNITFVMWAPCIKIVIIIIIIIYINALSYDNLVLTRNYKKPDKYVLSKAREKKNYPAVGFLLPDSKFKSRFLGPPSNVKLGNFMW